MARIYDVDPADLIDKTSDELKKIKAYQASSSWQEIQKQRPYINRDVSNISAHVINKFLSGELKLPVPDNSLKR